LPRIPPEIIPASIKPGTVYYFQEERYSSSHKHYFVVINKDPLTDEVLLLACASSKIDETLARRPYCSKNTFVIITPEQYDKFTSKSIFDCNRVLRKNISQIIHKYNDGELSIETEMDTGIVDSLRKAVLASNQIPPRIKSMLS
jgi:hypothetical protein